jgi:hypothetical protein
MTKWYICKQGHCTERFRRKDKVSAHVKEMKLLQHYPYGPHDYLSHHAMIIRPRGRILGERNLHVPNTGNYGNRWIPANNVIGDGLIHQGDDRFNDEDDEGVVDVENDEGGDDNENDGLAIYRFMDINEVGQAEEDEVIRDAAVDLADQASSIDMFDFLSLLGKGSFGKVSFLV